MRRRLRDATALDELLQLLPGPLGSALEMLAVVGQQALQELHLRRHGDVLADRHRGRARDQRGQPGEQHEMAARLRARDAEDQRDVGDQSVADPEHRRARRPALHLSRALPIGPPLGHQLSSIVRSSERVGRAASFGDSSGSSIGQSIPALSQRAPISSARS